jgi:hypothetical protein
VFQGAVFDQVARGDRGVVPRETHGEAEVDFGVSVEFGGAQLDDVAETFAFAVHAFDAVVVGCYAVERKRLAFDVQLDAETMMVFMNCDIRASSSMWQVKRKIAND